MKSNIFLATLYLFIFLLLGSINANVLIEHYIKRVVKPYMISKNFESVLLILDNATCHKSAAFRAACAEENIILSFIPPRMTPLLQPADVSWFAVLKKKYVDFWRDWLVFGEI